MSCIMYLIPFQSFPAPPACCHTGYRATDFEITLLLYHAKASWT
jgi:hypothetical protein